MPTPGTPARKTRPTQPTSQFGATTIFDHVGSAAAANQAAAALSPFDACQIGVVLRAVLFVHAVVAVAVSFIAESLSSWLLSFAYGAAIALPATLAWALGIAVVAGFGIDYVFGRIFLVRLP